MPFVILVIVAVFMLSQCSSGQSKEEIKACLQEAEEELASVQHYSEYAKIPSEKSSTLDYVRGNLYSDLKMVQDSMREYLSNENSPVSTIPFDFTKRCDVDRMVSRYKSRIFDLEREEAIAKADKVNEQIDAAQDAVLEEYARKSVKHTVVGGSGARVDTFVMKSGEVVYCKTTITDGGKAVDCH